MYQGNTDELVLRLFHHVTRHRRAGIADIVRRPSATQSAKGVLTAGLGKSLIYLQQKVAKRFSAK